MKTRKVKKHEARESKPYRTTQKADKVRSLTPPVIILVIIIGLITYLIEITF